MIMKSDNDIYVKEEVITFLIPQRTIKKGIQVWEFPTQKVLHDLFDAVRASIPHMDILRTMVRATVDPQTKIAEIELNTRNYTVFQMVRERIRAYNKVPSSTFDTYEKRHFIEKHGFTLYVPSQYATMPPTLIMAILCENHPQLHHPYKILQTSRFTTEAPGHIPGRKSRIGAMILLVEGSKPFMDGLAEFPEEYRFRLSGSWRMQIRGGTRRGQRRSNAPELELSESLQSLVMQGSANETMNRAKENATPDGE